MTARLRRALPERHSLVVNQMALGAYRAGFLRALESQDLDMVLLAGDEHFNRGVTTAVESRLIRRTGPNVFHLGRRVGWQRGCVVPGLLARALVVELNPRNLTSWLLLLARRPFGRRTAGWGHAHSRRGPEPAHNRGRRLMQRMCTDLIAYTATEASALATLHPGKRILVAFNSLYSADALSAFEVPELHERTDLLIIGRLVPEKKATLGIEGFALAAAKLPDEVTLHVVGSGQEGAEARSRLEGTPLLDRVRFHGQVSELADLAPIFLRCRALLAPGYIGLNATQALGFGLVVVYARDELHAPEIEALNDSNSMAFDSDDADACAEAIIDLFAQEARFDAHEIAAHARKTYTTDRMVDPFVELARYE